jgi:serine/threonine protein phosphatase PrpC
VKILQLILILSWLKVLVCSTETWKRNKTGDLSTAGTTASTIIFRQDHIFVANVGDSTAILAVDNPLAGQPNQHPVKALVLTKDHKPEDPDETKNIESLGKLLHDDLTNHYALLNVTLSDL